MRRRVKTAKCPLCGTGIKIDQYTGRGDVVFCSGCEEELVVISLDPLKLKHPPEVDDDYEGSNA